MLDKIKEEADPEVAAEAPAIGIQFTSTVGVGRQLTLTCGVHLNIAKGELNQVLDKLAGASDRQALKYEMHDREAAIASMYHQIEVQQHQKARYDYEIREHWMARGKQGDFRLTDDQKTKLLGYDTSIVGLQEKIVKQEKELEDLREKCR